ncbi:MAG: Vitamin B12 dependent methionine synthase activation subunit [Clostridia bacterium]|nr:Vitamin B12 dependent methionine synthase activation subunit [Clostridia bacterium]
MIFVIDSVPVDKREVARYLGYGKTNPDTATDGLIDKMIKTLSPSAKVWSMESPVTVSGASVSLDGLCFESQSLAQNLKGCEKAVVFGATLGIAFDRLLQRTEILSPAEAAVLQAVGTAAIESACDIFCERLGKTRPRFSPGYGDLPLTAQKDLFKVLDLPRRLGVTLTESLLMVPTKSVTAIVGMGETKCESGCATCTHPCVFRKEE